MPEALVDNRIIDMMHPEMLDAKMAESHSGEFGVRRALKTFKNSVGLAIKARFGR